MVRRSEGSGGDAWFRVSVGTLFVVGSVLRLLNAWTPLGERPFSGVPDDTFYYFSIAERIAGGKIPSVDGESATNGFHPLWMLFLTSMDWVVGFSHGSHEPLHVAFTVGAALDVFAAWLFLQVLERLRVRPSIRLFATAAFLLNPYQIEVATWGLETPLALVFLLAFVNLACVAPRATRRVPKTPLALGALGGGLILSRTDHAVIVAVALGILAVTVTPRARVSFLARTLGVAGLVALPWPVYSYLTTGTVVQSSSLAMAIVVDRMPDVWGLSREPVGLALFRHAASVAEALAQVATFSGISWAIVLVPLALIVAGRTLDPAGKVRLRARRRVLSPWIAGAVVLFLLHTLVRRVFREWYAAPFVVLALGVSATSLDVLLRSPRLGRWLSLAVGVPSAALLAYSWITGSVFEAGGYEGWDQGTGVRRGQTDCGALSYFSRDVIVNLDGVVNQAALDALRRGKLLDYAESKRLSSIAVAPNLHFPTFLGERYRERLLGVPNEPFSSRFASADEKNQALALGPDPISVGSFGGREILSDGWVWPALPEDRVASIGGRSELVVFAPEDPGDRATLVLDLAADPELSSDEDVSVSVSRTHLATLHVTAAPTRFRVVAPALVRGRNRVTLEYSAPRAIRRRSAPHWWSGWNWSGGNAVRAVTLGTVALEGGLVALPPNGPDLGSPRADAAFVHGFLPVERPEGDRPGVWAVAKDAELRFRADGASPRTLIVEVGPPPASAEDDGQRVGVILDDVPLASFRILPGTVGTFEFPVAASVLRSGENVLRFSFDRVAPPDADGVRRAAFFRKIELR